MGRQNVFINQLSQQETSQLVSNVYPLS